MTESEQTKHTIGEKFPDTEKSQMWVQITFGQRFASFHHFCVWLVAF